MILIPIALLIVGFLIGITFRPDFPVAWAPYAGIAALAGLDSVVGGTRALLDKRFYPEVFVSGVLINLTLAIGLGAFGTLINLNLFVAAAVVFVWRLIQNMGQVRRLLLSRYRESRGRTRSETELESKELSNN